VTAPDPMKGIRGIMAGTMVLEAIVTGLGLFVLSRVDHLSGWPVTAVAVLAVLMLVSCGFFGRPWGIPFALVLQVLILVGFVISVPLGVVGVLFGLVWAYLLWVRRDVARRIAEGTLPSQQQ
jgi:hypothetical protein